jgi:hypothetical protein
MNLQKQFVSSIGVTAVLCMLAAVPGTAGSLADPVNKEGSGVAIKGYDPVAYFTQGKPVKGSPSFVHQWMGATWWFASAEDRDQFAGHPQMYVPQYGGYCAYGVSQGHAVSIDPEAWKIVDGKLYLNYSRDVQKKWLQAIPQYIQEADRNWPALHN